MERIGWDRTGRQWNGPDGNGPEVDSRPVVIPSTKGRIMRHRPRFEEWSLKFSLRINDDLIDPNLVQQLLNEGGISNGLGEYRPQLGGPYGAFAVTSWQEQP